MNETATEKPKAAAPAFAKWIADYGIAELAVAAKVSPETVRKWDQYARGLKNGSPPNPVHMKRLVMLARGRVGAADIYQGVGKAVAK